MTDKEIIQRIKDSTYLSDSDKRVILRTSTINDDTCKYTDDGRNITLVLGKILSSKFKSNIKIDESID
jgi:type 1 fimbria pilin